MSDLTVKHPNYGDQEFVRLAKYRELEAELTGLREALRQIEERLSIEQMDSPPLPLLVLEALEIARNVLKETT